ncbi:hypothetical protein MMC18_002909 [Xylographa bjoerkii]|nr:hypothetical protein [Xylographa bjoerkii]
MNVQFVGDGMPEGQVIESKVSMRLDTGNGGGNAMIGGNDQMLTDETSEINELGTVLPSNGRQQLWVQPVKATWSLPFPPTEVNTPFASDLSAGDVAQWAVDPGEPQSVEGTLSATASQVTPFDLLATSRPQIERWSRASRYDMDQGDRIASSVASLSPVSARSSNEDYKSGLHNWLNKEPLTTKWFTQVYFSKIHPYWPILHAPTFDPENVSHVLLGSMVVLSSWLKGDLYHTKLAPLVFDAVTATLRESNHSLGMDTQPASLQILQALLLCITTDGMLARATNFNGILITNCRHLGIFSGQHAYRELGDCPSDFWLVQEQLHRLAFSVLRVDAYLSILVDYPPSVRYQEICIALPKSPSIWTAASEDERRSLQRNEPVGREKALFFFLVRDALNFSRRSHHPSHLTEADYHLVLCSLQVGTWEAAREAHICESDELDNDTIPRDSVQRWRSHLDLWRVTTEDNCQLRQNYFSASTSSIDHVSSPLSLILWHISALTLYAPLKLLQGQGCCFECGPSTAITTRKNKARLRAWCASPNARIAVWNAAQIFRIVTHEAASPEPITRLLLNPLAIPGVLKSAIVICSYAYHTRSCPVCTGIPPIDLVDLFDAQDDDARLVQWKEHGEGLADWSPGGFPVCECRLMALATWFRRALAIDKGAEQEFMSFLQGLRKG